MNEEDYSKRNPFMDDPAPGYDKNKLQNKLVYTANGVYKGHTEGGETLSGYFYSYSAMRRYAKKRGFSGVKKADSTFINRLWERQNDLSHINATRRD